MFCLRKKSNRAKKNFFSLFYLHACEIEGKANTMLLVYQGNFTNICGLYKVTASLYIIYRQRVIKAASVELKCDFLGPRPLSRV